jgi:hypothetical protein
MVCVCLPLPGTPNLKDATMHRCLNQRWCLSWMIRAHFSAGQGLIAFGT